MPTRLQQLNVTPWTGGLVTSRDQSLIQPNQLTQADNVLFSTQGTRLKRDGINCNWDDLDIEVASRSSSGTTRTLVTSGYRFNVGDQLLVTNSPNDAYNSGTVVANVIATDSAVKSTITFSNVSTTVTVGSTKTATISNATPGVVTVTNALIADDPVFFTTTGTLPSPLQPNVVYYANNPNSSSFQLALAPGGQPIVTTSAGSGTHTVCLNADTINWTANGLALNDAVFFTSTEPLPSPIISKQQYFVVVANTDSIKLSSFVGGVPGITTTLGSGTITAYKGATVVNWTANGLVELDPIIFTSSVALPTEIIAGQVYFVRNVATDSFQISNDYTGSLVLVATSGSGTITARRADENIISYTFTGATSLTESSTADTAIVITLKTRVIALYDYWYGTTGARTEAIMGMTSAGALFSFSSSGARTYIQDGGTPYEIPVGGLDSACLIAFENRLMIAVSGQNNPMKQFFPTDVGGGNTMLDVINTSPIVGQDPSTIPATPSPTFLQVYLDRLWCNDKSNTDRLHYSEVGIYNQWEGEGTSGALDIEPGDGDPEGLTAIMPPFKGTLFVAKRTKLYRIDGTDPDTFTESIVSSGLGCVGHKAVAQVDQDDLLFVSDKGVHSINTTNAFGDFYQTFISADIQTSVTNTWNRSRMKYIQAAYCPQINSVAFALAENTDSDEQTLWLYNFPLKNWYRWPGVNCSSICNVNTVDKQRYFLGQDNGRVAKTFDGANFDTNPAGQQKAINMIIASGLIYPTGNMTMSAAYKRLTLIYRPSGKYTITANFKIDNFTGQGLVYNDTGGNDLLGSTFILNQSVLGIGLVTMPFTQPVDGYGRAFKLMIQQSGLDEFGEILGFVVSYESTEPVYENRDGDDT